MNALTHSAMAYALIIRNSIRQRKSYAAGQWLQILHGIFMILIQASLWTSLIGSGSAGDTSLKAMISYVIINFLASSLTRFNAAGMIGGRVRDGSVAIDMILPVSFKWKLFCEHLGDNLFSTLYAGIPGVLVAVLFYGAAAPASLGSFLLFLPALLLGIVLAYQIQYLFNLAAFWVVDTWFISFLSNGFSKLFGGAVIPLWFYPAWLAAMSRYLPFRFCTYEPIRIYLGQCDIKSALSCLGLQVLWLVLLFGLEAIIWRRASKKIFVQGG